MLFKLLSGFIVVLHLIFIIFVLFGALLALRWRKVIWLHIPAVVWGALIEFLDKICPLTPLENYFRNLGGSEVYSGDFIEKYINPVLYPTFLTRNLQLILGLIVIAVNLIAYIYVFHKMKRT
ncbi:MAG: DUF2784 domain-containing protein [Bacteroidales bacterium]|nr:DUF2784 domain-containing protein [Bacteroidales bacterium]